MCVHLDNLVKHVKKSSFFYYSLQFVEELMQMIESGNRKERHARIHWKSAELREYLAKHSFFLLCRSLAADAVIYARSTFYILLTIPSFFSLSFSFHSRSSSAVWFSSLLCFCFGVFLILLLFSSFVVRFRCYKFSLTTHATRVMKTERKKGDNGEEEDDWSKNCMK